jgi:hypothetical protein
MLLEQITHILRSKQAVGFTPVTCEVQKYTQPAAAAQVVSSWGRAALRSIYCVQQRLIIEGAPVPRYNSYNSYNELASI